MLEFIKNKLQRRVEVKRRAECKKAFVQAHEDFYKDLKN